MFCLSSPLLNGWVCASDFAIKTFEYENVSRRLSMETFLIQLNMGRFVLVHLRSTLCLRARWHHHRMLRLKMR